MRKLRITVDGKSYDVVVEVMGEEGSAGNGAPVGVPNVAPAPVFHSAAAAPPPAASPAASSAGGAGAVTAPMAGTVVDVVAKLGAKVKRGDTLLVVEAMKMNSNIPAPADGTVKEIAVKPGDSVGSGQVLVVLDA